MIGIAYPAFFTSFKHYIPKLEMVRNNVKDFDLIIFSGGQDINPEIYNEELTFTHGFSLERDEIELNILEQALNLNKKILGVCRGHQLVNAYLGGKLYQDMFMETGADHINSHRLDFGSTMLKLYFSYVNSLHHQAVKVVGKGLRSTSKYNGIIESTEGENIITVQWHPEFMGNSKRFFDFILEWSDHGNI
jgi:putative glutamine amidotransferase